MKNWMLVTLFVGGPLACSSTPVALPTEMSGSRMTVQLPAKGSLVLRYRFKAVSENCKNLKTQIAPVIRNQDGRVVPSSFHCDEGERLIRVQTTNAQSPGPYEISIRSQRRRYLTGPVAIEAQTGGESSRSAKAQVVDCYPVGSGMAVAVLKVSGEVQVNDSIAISASDANGNRRHLGRCVVKNVDGTEASCEMQYNERAEWVDFRVEGVFSKEVST